MSRTLNKLHFGFLFQSCKRSIDSFDGERMKSSELKDLGRSSPSFEMF
jgi:hypothetical protein